MRAHPKRLPYISLAFRKVRLRFLRPKLLSAQFCLKVTLAPISPSLCATLSCNLSEKSSLRHTSNPFSPTQTQPSLNGLHAHLATQMRSRRTGRKSRATNYRNRHYVTPTSSSRWRVYGRRSPRRISESMRNGPRKAVSPMAAVISWSV
jgi:hypothetical protein